MQKQVIQQSIDSIRMLIADGKTMKAVDSLLLFTEELKHDMYRDTALSISGSKRLIIREEMMSSASSDDLAARKNRLNAQILTLLTLIEDEQIEGKKVVHPTENITTPPPPKKGAPWNVIVPVALILIAGFVYFMSVGGNGKDDSARQVCELRFESAVTLFENNNFEKAREAFYDMIGSGYCNDYVQEANDYIARCNENMNTDVFKVFKVELNATPAVYRGPCRKEVMFSGRIYTNQKGGELNYFIEFENGRGTNSPTKTIPSSGIVEFSIGYPFDAEDIFGEQMQAYLRVIKPISYKSEPIILELKCEEEQPSQPNEPTQQAILDKRDGRKYSYEPLGKVAWLTRNMALEIGDAKCISNSDCENGRLYSFKNVQDVCPKGYVIPNIDQFQDLETSIGDFNAVVKRLRIQPIKNNKAIFWASTKGSNAFKTVSFDFNTKAVSVTTPQKGQQYACRCASRPLILNINPDLIKTPQRIDPKLLDKKIELKRN